MIVKISRLYFLYLETYDAITYSVVYFDMLIYVCIFRHTDALAYGPDDTFLVPQPFYHLFGQLIVTLSALRQGSRIVILPKFHPEHYLSCMEKYKVCNSTSVQCSCRIDSFIQTEIQQQLRLFSYNNFTP